MSNIDRRTAIAQLGGLVLGYTAFNERKIRAGLKQLRVALSEIAS